MVQKAAKIREAIMDDKTKMYKCANCKSYFSRYKSQMKESPPYFCSDKCYQEARKLLYNPEKHDYSKKKKRYCWDCGRIFYIYEYKIKIGGGKYCSQACYHNSRREKLSELK
jgi:hypothetical protein